MKKKETSSVRTILPSRRRKSSNRAFGVYPFQGEVLLSTTYGDSPDGFIKSGKRSLSKRKEENKK
ncbi:hypothetical protein V1477_014933 [Vespula maculifrons]|uniref:Uncharacterized protein n=1 Tax=Vespula maculifrons TaxID=7453 RepID=A0ABD2BIV4_VESMC